MLKTISSAHAIAACSGFLITSNRVGRAMIDRSCDKGRGTLARDSSARLDRRDARHPSEHANPNRGGVVYVALPWYRKWYVIAGAAVVTAIVFGIVTDSLVAHPLHADQCRAASGC